MKDNYKIERRGEYYCLINNNKVEYKSKDKEKVQSRYDGRIRAQHNQIDREIRARNYRWIWLWKIN